MADYEKQEGEKPQEDDKKILEDARACLKQCIDEEEDERAKMEDDLRFCSSISGPTTSARTARIRRKRAALGPASRSTRSISTSFRS
jgi:hypothetical protein